MQFTLSTFLIVSFLFGIGVILFIRYYFHQKLCYCPTSVSEPYSKTPADFGSLLFEVFESLTNSLNIHFIIVVNYEDVYLKTSDGSTVV